MQNDTIEHLGLSPAAARVLKAQLESGLAGPGFMIGLSVAYGLTAVFWLFGLVVIGWSVKAALDVGSLVPLSAGLFALPFMLIPLVVLMNFRRLDRARRG